MLLEGKGMLLDRQAQRHEIISQTFLKKSTEGILKTELPNMSPAVSKILSRNRCSNCVEEILISSQK
jgi:hypothetical protein